MNKSKIKTKDNKRSTEFEKLKSGLNKTAWEKFFDMTAHKVNVLDGNKNLTINVKNYIDNLELIKYENGDAFFELDLDKNDTLTKAKEEMIGHVIRLFLRQNIPYFHNIKSMIKVKDHE